MMNTKVNSSYERLPSCIASCLFSPLRHQETESEQPLPHWCACIFTFFFFFLSFLQNCFVLHCCCWSVQIHWSYGCHYAAIRMMAGIKHHCRCSYLSFSHTSSWKYEVNVFLKCFFIIKVVTNTRNQTLILHNLHKSSAFLRQYHGFDAINVISVAFEVCSI